MKEDDDLPKGVIKTTIMCPKCGTILLFRPPNGKKIWCPQFNWEGVRCGYSQASPPYFAAKNDPRQGTLL